MMVEQFGFVTMMPRASPREDFCESSSARCSWFTSGMRSGTSLSIRSAEELLMTAWPARANDSSVSRAISPGRLENTTSQSNGGLGGRNTRARTSSRLSPRRSHAQNPPASLTPHRTRAALALWAEGRAGHGDDAVFEQPLGDRHRIAERAHVNHRVESAFGPDGAQVKFVGQQSEQVFAALAERLTNRGARRGALFSPRGERGLLRDGRGAGRRVTMKHERAPHDFSVAAKPAQTPARHA